MTLPTPAELGLPKKFHKGFRPQQGAAIERIARSDKNIILLQAPPGSGKTLLMAGLAKYLKSRVLYTAHTKQLQDQVMRDFESYAVELKGRSNYPCLKGGKFTCNECSKKGGSSAARCKECQYTDCDSRFPAHNRETCPCKDDCLFELQKQKAENAEMAVLNTPLFLNENRFSDSFRDWPWVVLDEGDLTENALMSFIGVSITSHQIRQLGLAFPKTKTVAEAWFKWIQEQAIPAVDFRLAQIANSGDFFELREKTELERLSYKLNFLIHENLKNWVFIPEEKPEAKAEEKLWTFKPVFVSRYAQPNLWDHGKRFLVMSATLISKYQCAQDFGLKDNECEWIDLPSTFPVSRRPIYFRPAADMAHKNKDHAWPQMVKAIDAILEKHRREKGIIHTVSYPLARYVMEHSKYSSRMIEHDSGNRISALERFKADPSPSVMISPSMDRGVDLPYELCRFLMVPKVPFPNLGDEQVSRRLYTAQDGQLWYAVQTIRTLIQATGRGMRAEDDECKSYILDEAFRRLYSQYYNLFPAYWREAICKD